jgi:hypothetical protein
MEGFKMINFVICVLVFAFGFAFGMAITNDLWKQELVNKGLAEWVIKAGSKEVEFKYK